MSARGTRMVVVMMDGFGPEYLQASDMPNLKAMISRGFYKTVQACVPTVTNVNNASICTGVWPAAHGITANSYFDLDTRQEHYMDRAEMLLAPTLFEQAAKAGHRSALLTAKVKTIRLLNAGADVAVAAEAPDAEWVQRLGAAPDIYSPDINYWVFAAALRLLTTDPDMAVLYCHTTDYPIHMGDHTGELSQRHLAEIDRWLGRIADARERAAEAAVRRPAAGGRIVRGVQREDVMATNAKATRATVIPCLRYRDAPAAIEWLCSAFGFDKQLVVPGPAGTIAHAQLSFGNGMIMVGSAVDSESGRLMKQPDEIGGAETQTAYVVVADADAHYARAVAAGAKIVLDIKDEDYGGRGYSCRDPEGHLWNVGHLRSLGGPAGVACASAS